MWRRVGRNVFPSYTEGQVAVRAALQRAQTLFPFPILGLDTDNGVEFINEEVASFCEAEQITFTRGRARQKRDQCFVEQKNGAIVRHMVGYERLDGPILLLNKTLIPFL